MQYALRLFHSRLRDDAIHVVHQWPEETLWVEGDLVRLEQVLVNLIGNAVQAMKEVEAPVLTLSAQIDDAHIVISVADNGPGIATDHLGHIFEPFFTTKAPGSGLGLGLSISSRIMEDLGGKLQARNLVDGGACFTVTLPRSPAPSASRHEQENPSHA